MGAGQIGGIATLLDLDFDNAAGFIGQKAVRSEAQFITYFLSHAMMFCAGALIEPHIILTPASCVFGEKYKFEIFAGTHEFLENSGVQRLVDNVCLHKGYNHSKRWKDCTTDNIALLILQSALSFYKPEENSDFVINRIRYGVAAPTVESLYTDRSCRFYGWGSRRNGYLIPLLLYLRRVDVTILPSDKCSRIWNYGGKYLCILQPACKSEAHGTMCPDDLGTVIVCSGFAVGIMTTRLVDRPCGVGFVDLSKYSKFLTCGVDDSRDVIDHEAIMEFDFTTRSLLPIQKLEMNGETTNPTKQPKEKLKKSTTPQEEIILPVNRTTSNLLRYIL